MLASEGCLRKCDIVISICNRCCAEGFASADATRGQWKQTNVCGRPLTPSQSPPMLLGFYRYKGDKKENNGSSRNLGGRAAWGRVCGRAKLGAGTLRCLHLCGLLLLNWSPAEQLGRCPKPHKGRCPLTLQGTLSLDPFLAPRLERASHAVSCRGFLPFSPLPYWNKDIISCGDSPPTMDSPGLISWSNSAFFRCPSATTCSSIEACVTRRITSTLRVCPMRYARSVA